MSEVTHHLDIRKDVCPMTFVKMKLMLERMQQGELVEVRLSEGEAVDNMPKALVEQGHHVISSEHRENDVIFIVKKG